MPHTNLSSSVESTNNFIYFFFENLDFSFVFFLLSPLGLNDISLPMDYNSTLGIFNRGDFSSSLCSKESWAGFCDRSIYNSSKALLVVLSILMSKVKLVPFSFSDYTFISPFRWPTIILDIVRPNPMPPLLQVLEEVTFPKNLNSFC